VSFFSPPTPPNKQVTNFSLQGNDHRASNRLLPPRHDPRPTPHSLPSLHTPPDPLRPRPAIHPNLLRFHPPQTPPLRTYHKPLHRITDRPLRLPRLTNRPAIPQQPPHTPSLLQHPQHPLHLPRVQLYSRSARQSRRITHHIPPKHPQPLPN